MQFKSYTIIPKGRNKYGNYISAGNVTKQVITTTYAGNGTTTDINTGGTEDKHDEIENWLLFLSKTSNVFDGQSVAIVPVTDTVSLIGYRGQVKAQTYIGDISTTATSATYNITGITESGMSVSVSGNGTSSTTLNITVSSAITESSGKITIPCNVYLKALSLGDDISAWNSFQSDCMTVPLEYSWSITSNASSAYILDLTNDSAGINCDSEGNILPGAIRPTCTARLFYGTEIATGVTYHISYPSTQQVAGVTIDTNTGILTFGSNFNFIGTALEITVLGKINGETLGIKIMTISKNIAGQNGADGQNGQDGQDGQDGSDGVDGEDGTSIIWQGTYSSHPSNPQNGWAYYNSTTKKSYTYKDGTWYQMTMDGTNGHDGKSIIWKGESANPPANPEVNWCYRDTDNGRIYVYNGTAWELMTRDGDDGTDGTDGTDGLSVFITYHDNAATNKPSKPTEDGTTGGWHTDTTPNVVWMSQKVSESASTGTWGEPIQIKGTNGANAITKWISLSANEVKVNPTTSSCTPSTITVNVFEQLGEQTPEMIEETVYWGYDTVSPITTITTPHTITVSSGYTYLTFGLKNEYDEFFEIETVQILKDGIKGEKGDKGDAGRQGAAMRGPVDWWKQETARRFCNGVLTDPTYPEDAQYIDIVIKDKVTYICTTSFTGSANDPWSSVSSNFTAAPEKYDFVATNVLLADNASINFTTTNGLYLRNNSGTITAGAEGGNGINYWAGSDTPSDAPFTVNNDGVMKATKGQFGCLNIGHNSSYERIDSINSEFYYGYENETYKSEISPTCIYMEGGISSGSSYSAVTSVLIDPYGNMRLLPYDSSSSIEVITTDNRAEYREEIYTNAKMRADNGFVSKFGYSVSSLLNGVKIGFITNSSSHFSKNTSDNYWYFHGVKTNTRCDNYQYVGIVSNQSSVNYGKWMFYNGSNPDYGHFTGVLSTNAIKNNDTIYFTI